MTFVLHALFLIHLYRFIRLGSENMDERSGHKKIEVKNATKIFGKNIKKANQLLKEGKSKNEILKAAGATVGVKNASFDVYEGEIFVIMGLSGSGKSTLVRLLNRLIDPTAGHILLDGADIVQMNKEQLREVRRKKLGWFFKSLPYSLIEIS